MKYLKYLFAAVLLFSGAAIVGAATSFEVPTQVSNYKVVSLLNATTTTATSTNLTDGGGYAVIAGAKKVVFYFTRGWGAGNSGSTNFKIQVSPDGSTWNDYNTLLQNSATSTARTAISSVTVPAGTSTVMAYPEYLGFYAVRCIAVETTDGAHTCKVGIEN